MGERHFTLPPEESPVSCAEIISLSEVRASTQWEALRHQLHTRFDQWLDALEQQWSEPPSTFPEGTATVWNLRPQRTGSLTETIVAPVHRSEHERLQGPCTRCEGVWRARECVCRTVETLGGAVQLERPYFYGRSGHLGRSPLDEV